MKKRTNIYIDPDLLQAIKAWASRTGRKDQEILEDALRSFLGLDVVQSVWARSDVAEEEAMKLAYDEVHSSRK